MVQELEYEQEQKGHNFMATADSAVVLMELDDHWD